MDDKQNLTDKGIEDLKEKLPLLKESFNKENLIEMAKKGISPFIGILTKYRDDVTPFIESLNKGCEVAAKHLDEGEGKADKIVSSWYRESTFFLNEMNESLRSEDSKAMFNFIKDQTNKRPIMILSTSYLLGLVSGRLSKMSIQKSKTRNLH